MKKIIVSIFMFTLIFALTPTAEAGDCTKRDVVDWHATISTAVNVRNDCPSGDVVGVVKTGEVVRILEVDKHGDFYLIETSVGTGFVYNSFLKDIQKVPLVKSSTPVVFEENIENEVIVEEKKHQEEKVFSESAFIDLDPNHKYYDHIVNVKNKGIVGGTAEGKIKADSPINRAELSKILVEATSEEDEITNAIFSSGMFSDIETGAWYVVYLHLAKEKGIMTGDAMPGGGVPTVRPADSANGAEVAKMIAIAFGLEVDQPAANEDWFIPYMRALQEKDALPYNDANHQVTRGEMMFMISTLLGE